MKILALEPGFPPETTSARIPYEFAKELTERGNEVLVVTPFPRKHLTEKKRNSSLPRGKMVYFENMDGMNVVRVGPQIKSNRPMSRVLEYTINPLTAFLVALSKARNYDVIHCQTPPLTLPLLAGFFRFVARKPLVVRVQDIHPDALIKLGLLLKGSVFAKIFFLMEQIAYRNATHITVISDAYKDDLVRRGVNSSKVTMIPNWSHTDEVQPKAQDIDEFRRSQQLSGKFIFTYSGSISYAQDLETIVETANILKNRDDIVFLMVGDGIKRESLIKRRNELNLTNVKFLPFFQSRADYLQMIFSSDACFVPLKKDYVSPTFPSKALEIMGCAKPIIANVPKDSEIYKLVKKADCGVWVEPQNPQALAKTIVSLVGNGSSLKTYGANGLTFVKKNMSLKKCIDDYEELFRKVTTTKD